MSFPEALSLLDNIDRNVGKARVFTLHPTSGVRQEVADLLLQAEDDVIRLTALLYHMQSVDMLLYR